MAVTEALPLQREIQKNLHQDRLLDHTIGINDETGDKICKIAMDKQNKVLLLALLNKFSTGPYHNTPH